MRAFFTLLCILLPIGAAHTKEKPCDGTPDPTRMALCAGETAQAAERKLNQTYRRLSAGIEINEAEFVRMYPERDRLPLKADLAASQRAWLNYRTQTCKLKYDLSLTGSPHHGGPPARDQMYCMAEMAKRRAVELEELFNSYGVTRVP